jgi:GTP pyrophosphokinase
MIIPRRDCPQVVEEREPERVVEIDWGIQSNERYTVDVEIRANDRRGLLRDITDLVAQMGVNVRSAKAESRDKEGNARMRLSLDLASVDQVVQVVARIARYPDVVDVRRITGSG